MAESEIRNLSGVHRFLRILGIIVSVGLALYALPILAGHWLLFLAMPFISFTFTDPPDFIFAGLIVLTLTALAVRHGKRPYPPGWVKTASVAAMVLAVVAPLVPMVALYLLAYRGQDLIGHWPQPMTDDPKHIGLDDPAYEALQAAVVYSSCFAGWGIATWGALLVHLRRNLPPPEDALDDWPLPSRLAGLRGRSGAALRMVVGLTSSFSRTSRSRELDLLVLCDGTRTLPVIWED